MSTLHERLLAATVDDGNVKGCGECGQPHEAMAAVRAIVELHAPKDTHYGRPDEDDCAGCDWGAYADGPACWPCPTITAIASALGVGGD